MIALMQRLPGGLQRLRNLIARHAGKAGEALADQVDARHFAIRRAQRAAVLIPGTQKPLACPGSLHGALQLDALRVQLPAHAFLAQRGKFAQHHDQKEAQPRAFAAHTIHAIVPVAALHQRNAVLPIAHARDGAQAVLHQRGCFGGLLGCFVAVMLRIGKLAGAQKGRVRAQNIPVGGYIHIPRCHIGQEQ